MKQICALLVVLMSLNSCTQLAKPGAPTTAPVQRSDLKLEGTFSSLMDGILADGGANSCVSPLSIKLALAMAYNGTSGETAELLSALFAATPSEMNEWAREFMTAAAAYDGERDYDYAPPNAELRVANSIWIRKGLDREIGSKFIAALTKSYKAEVGTFDSSPAPINDWISNATNGKIKNMLADIDPNALSYLVNALYFNAEWYDDFNKNRTAPEDFHNANGSTVQVDMLHGVANGYIDTPEFEGMTKRLNGSFTFAAFMPKTDAAVTLDALNAALSAVDYDYTTVNLTLPKFDFDTTVGLTRGRHPEFDALFAAHGMDGALANNPQTTELAISEILHKTTFTLAEAGIEASAATVIAMAGGAMLPPTPREVSIVFDKPFYFTLTDKNGEVLFVGKVANM